MPRKDGTLSAVELRRLIKQHNKLMSIQIPKGTNRDGLIKLITKNGYTINHSAQKLEPTVKMKRKPVVKLPPAPVKKTEEEKKQAKDKRDKKRREIESEGIKKALALKKVRNKKIKIPEKVDDKRAELLKLIRDNKEWLVPSRMAPPHNNRYNYELNSFKRNKDKPDMVEYMLSNLKKTLAYFKSGKQEPGGIINPFGKKGNAKMPNKK